jgi:hypothetical protein
MKDKKEYDEHDFPKVIRQINSHSLLSYEQLQHAGMPSQPLEFELEASNHLARAM